MNVMNIPGADLPPECTRVEIGKLMAQTVRLGAETAKMRPDRAWHAVVLMTGALVAGAAFGMLFG